MLESFQSAERRPAAINRLKLLNITRYPGNI